MKKRIFISALVLGTSVLFCPVLVSAQAIIELPNATRAALNAARSRTFLQGLRAGSRRYISPSIRLGQEAILPPNTSKIGNAKQHEFLRVQRKTQFLGQTLSNKIARKVTSSSAPEIFPGFHMNFSKKWYANEERVRKHTLSHMKASLEGLYGLDKVAEGDFVQSFEEVGRLSLKPVENPVTIEQSVNEAFAKAKEMQSGFFVIRIKGNARRPKDTLILDLNRQSNGDAFRWISFNQSKARAWSQRITQDRQTIENPSWQASQAEDLRSTQGIMIWPMEEDVLKLRVSSDGEHWLEYPLEGYSPAALTGRDILTAWNKGYYIVLPQEQGGPVGFAAAPGKRIFNRIEEVAVMYPDQANASAVEFASPKDTLIWKYANQVGLSTKVIDGQIFVRFPENAPRNLHFWLHDGQAYQTAAGRLLTGEPAKEIKDVTLMRNLLILARKVEEKWPGRKILFEPEYLVSPEIEEVEKQMWYISKDNGLFSSSIDEIIEYEERMGL